MKRKLSAIILTLCLVLVGIFALSACSDTSNEGTDTPNHTHEYTESVTKEATCTEEGEKAFTCSCGYARTEPIPSKGGHNPEAIPENAPTCTEDGNTAGEKCTVCGEILTATSLIPATGHKAEAIPEKAATCTEDGNTAGEKCSECGEILTATSPIPATGHSVVEIFEKSPTCTEPGNIAYHTCTVCQKIYADNECTTQITASETVIAAYGHEMNYTPRVDATCTDKGNISYYTCSVCENIYRNANGTDKISESETVISENGHTILYIDSRAATCTESGNIAYYTCTTCGKMYLDERGTEEITENDLYSDALGHLIKSVEFKAAICIYPGNIAHYVCEHCGDMYSDEEGLEQLTAELVTIPAPGMHIDKNTDCICDDCGRSASEGLVFTISSDKISYSLTGIGTCTDTDVFIPAVYEGLQVTSIGNSAFSYCSSLTSITISDGVTSIDDYAFYKCTSLTSITIPDSVTSIGFSAFYNCSSLTSIEIPDGVTSIGDYAFDKCTSLTSITIPDSVTSIGDGAFWGCESLTSITIPDSVTEIGGWAFFYCSSLKSVQIGNSVTLIGSYAFSYCSSLTSITIPNSITEIGQNAFNSCDSLTKVYITDISKWCAIDFKDTASNPLYYAENLYLNGELVTDLVIPDGVTSIGSSAFYNCTSLTSITIPNSVTSIGSYAFEGCSSLQYNIYDNAKYLGNENNSYLALIEAMDASIINCNIHNNTKIIGSSAFRSCRSLTSITIPDSVTSIGSSAFENCSSLTSVTIGNSVTSIGSYAFSYCSSLTSITIPDSVTSIGDGAFWSCESLTSITIPDSVTSIGDYAFFWCSRLTSVTIGNSVTSIGSSAFFWCSRLTSVTIGNSITSIGEEAFSGCYNLVEIYNKSSLNVEQGSSNYGYIGIYALNVYTADSGESKLDFRDDGYIFYADGEAIFLVGYMGTEASLVLPENYNGKNYAIHQYAFYDCTSLTSVTIPDSVTSIGNSAFSYCTSLTSVTIPDSVTSIGNSAFSYCSSLTSITIPDGVTSIGEEAFYECTSLTDITFEGTM